MPTGYTDQIISRKATFPQFVWSCARGFGALLHMRDSANGVPIKAQPKDTFYKDQLAQAKKDLAEAVSTLSAKEIQKQIDKEHEHAMGEYTRLMEKQAAERARYQAMLDQVVAWVPPTKDHIALKTFMVEQIESTIKFDCDWGKKPPVKPTPGEWRAGKIAFAKRMVENYTEHVRRENDQINNSNQWVEDLAKSVPMPSELL